MALHSYIPQDILRSLFWVKNCGLQALKGLSNLEKCTDEGVCQIQFRKIFSFFNIILLSVSHDFCKILTWAFTKTKYKLWNAHRTWDTFIDGIKTTSPTRQNDATLNLTTQIEDLNSLVIWICWALQVGWCKGSARRLSSSQTFGPRTLRSLLAPGNWNICVH